MASGRVPVAQNTEEKIETWCFCKTAQELDQCLLQLCLRADGDRFARMSRLSNWLKGNYTPEDFVQEGGEDPALNYIKHESARKTFIEEEIKAGGQSYLNETLEDGEAHPLESVIDDEDIQMRLSASRLRHGIFDVDRHTSDMEISSRNPSSVEEERREPPPNSNAARSSAEKPTLESLQCQIDRMQLMIESLTSAMTSLIEHRPNRASSTRVDDEQNRPRTVNIRDTFTVLNSSHADNSRPEEPLQPLTVPSPHTSPRGRGAGWRGVKPRERTDSPGLTSDAAIILLTWLQEVSLEILGK